MVSVTLSIPDDVKKKMDYFSEVNWSGFIRKEILEKVGELSWKDELRNKIKEEQDITDWSVKLQRVGRKDRFEVLKKKGLI